MAEILLLNKPYHMLSQFTDADQRQTLKSILADKPGFYVAGRLDYDSEGLLLLTNHGRLQHVLSHPKFGKEKTYWVQVDGQISADALQKLAGGVILKDGKTKPAKVKTISPPKVWPRQPPIRVRKHIPTSWIEMRISEGKNRQVRRMTAAVGFPTLRLIRASIAEFELGSLAPGECRSIHLTQTELNRMLKTSTALPDNKQAKTNKRRFSQSKTSNAKRYAKFQGRQKQP